MEETKNNINCTIFNDSEKENLKLFNFTDKNIDETKNCILIDTFDIDNFNNLEIRKINLYLTYFYKFYVNKNVDNMQIVTDKLHLEYKYLNTNINFKYKNKLSEVSLNIIDAINEVKEFENNQEYINIEQIYNEYRKIFAQIRLNNDIICESATKNNSINFEIYKLKNKLCAISNNSNIYSFVKKLRLKLE